MNQPGYQPELHFVSPEAEKTMAHRALPSALEPYIRLPPETSVILLTSTLGCSVDWLTARFVAVASRRQDGGNEAPSAPVVLVSWLHDEEFFRNEVKRSGGSSRDINFTFIDCSSSFRALSDTERLITNAIEKQKGGDRQKPLLILSSPSLMLATAQATSCELNAFVLRLRHLCHAVILTCPADSPLLSSAVAGEDVRASPMEMECARFITTQAHAAKLILSVRELETGAARDVSGVLRITGGGCYCDDEFGDGGEGHAGIKEAEMLYLVQRDGSANVFSRGAGGID